MVSVSSTAVTRLSINRKARARRRLAGLFVLDDDIPRQPAPSQEQNVEISDQLATYDDYWHKFGAQVAGGDGVGEFSESESQVVCATIVARLPTGIATALVDVLKPLRRKFPDHYFYPADTIHLTLLDVSPLIEDGDLSRIPLAAVNAFSLLERELHDQPPLKLRLQGLGLFPTTIFGQLLDLEGRITYLRERVSELLRRETGAVLRPAVAPGLVFANLVRYSAVPATAVVDEVSAFRERPRLSFEVANFEVVTTDKVLSRRCTTVHARLKFAG